MFRPPRWDWPPIVAKTGGEDATPCALCGTVLAAAMLHLLIAATHGPAPAGDVNGRNPLPANR